MAGPALLRKFELNLNTMTLKLHNILVIRNREERHVLHLVGAGIQFDLHQIRPQEVVAVNDRFLFEAVVRSDGRGLQLPEFMQRLLA